MFAKEAKKFFKRSAAALLGAAMVCALLASCKGDSDDGDDIIAVESVALSKDGETIGDGAALKIAAGEELALTATVTPENATDKTVAWQTSDAEKATVENGIVAIAQTASGTVTITASAGGEFASCEITVITLDAQDKSIDILPSGKTLADDAFTGIDETVATIEKTSDGKINITPKTANGATAVTVKYGDGAEEVFAVTIDGGEVTVAKAPQVEKPLIISDGEKPATITITCATEGAEIYYTTDGSAPDAAKPAQKYAAPFEIAETTAIKAIATKAVMKNSEVAEGKFEPGVKILAVKFELSGGEFDEGAAIPQSVKSGEKITKPSDPAKDGFKFSGWYADENFSTEFNFDAPVSQSVTLYALWKQGYFITFNANAPKDLPSGVSVQGEMARQFFEKAEGGEGSVQQKLIKCAFTLDGYYFKGWAQSATATAADFKDEATGGIRSDTTLYAVWEKPVAITFVKNSDEATGEMQAMSVEKGKYVTLTKCAFSRAGYIFKGWSDSASSTYASYTDEKQTSFTSDTTLYAVWEKPVAVTFVKNSDEATGDMQAMSVEKGKTVTLTKCAFSRAGYIFKGWSKAADATTVEFTDETQTYFRSDTTLYAVWEKLVAVTFDKGSDEATGEMHAMSVEKGKTVTLTKCAFSRVGYIFKGWSTFAGSVYDTRYEDENKASFTSDTTLYAVWVAKECKATFDKNGAASGEVTDTNTYNYGYKDSQGEGYFTFPENAFVYDADHGFAGWAASAKPTSADKIYSAGEKVVWLWDGDQTFYAVWGDKNANPLKVNGAAVGDAGAFVFDTTAATDFVFTGELFVGDFKKILDAAKGLATGLNLDFSACEGVSFALKDGTPHAPVVDSAANIKSIKLPPNLSKAPECFFYGNDNLTSVEVDGKTETIGYEAFCGCENLSAVSLNEGLKTIGDYAFYSTAISSVTLPDTLETLGSSAFKECSSLVSINIPASVKTIGDDCFSVGGRWVGANIVTGALTTITVDGANANYSSADGVLYNKGKTLLITYPCAKADTSFAVPATVTEIKSNAFSYAQNLAKVHIPQTVQTIHDYPFYPFYKCKSTLKIYCEAASKPAGFDRGWNYKDNSGYSLPVKYGVSANALASQIPADKTVFTVSGDPIEFYVATRSYGSANDVVLRLKYDRTGKGANDLIAMKNLNLIVDVKNSSGSSKYGFPKTITTASFALDQWDTYFDNTGKAVPGATDSTSSFLLASYIVDLNIGATLSVGDEVVVTLDGATVTRPSGSSVDFRGMLVAVIDHSANAGGVAGSYYAELGEAVVGGESYAPLISTTDWQ